MKEYKCREREEGGGPSRDDWTTYMTVQVKQGGPSRDQEGKRRRGRPK